MSTGRGGKINRANNMRNSLPQNRKFILDDKGFSKVIERLNRLEGDKNCEHPDNAEVYMRAVEDFESIHVHLNQWVAMAEVAQIDFLKTLEGSEMYKRLGTLHDRLMRGEKASCVVAKYMDLAQREAGVGGDESWMLCAVEMEPAVVNTLRLGAYPGFLRQNLLVPFDSNNRGVLRVPTWAWTWMRKSGSMDFWAIQALSGIAEREAEGEAGRAALNLWRPEDEYHVYYRYEDALAAVRKIWRENDPQ